MGQNRTFRILLTGGGSLGHTIPVISVVNELKKQSTGAEFLFVGTNPKVEKEFVESSGITYINITSGKLRRYFSLKNILDLLKFTAGIFRAHSIIRKFKPDVVFSKGGYASLPISVVAGKKGIPLVVHESDSTPGLANKIAAKRAKAICVAFDDMKKYYPNKKVVLTGNPIRGEIFKGDKSHGKEVFKLGGEKPVLFFTVASSSAKNFSRAIIEAAPRLLSNFQIIQQCGAMNYDLVQKRLRDVFGENDLVWDEVDTRITVRGDRHYCVIPTLKKEIADAYAVSDLVISRSSASTAFELATLGKPALFLPLPMKDSRGDQIHNANYFKQYEAAEVIENEKLSAEFLEKKIMEIFNTPGKLDKLSVNIKKLANSNAAENIAKVILRVIPAKTGTQKK